MIHKVFLGNQLVFYTGNLITEMDSKTKQLIDKGSLVDYRANYTGQLRVERGNSLVQSYLAEDRGRNSEGKIFAIFILLQLSLANNASTRLPFPRGYGLQDN